MGKSKIKQPLEILLKKSDRLTMKFLDGKTLHGEVTNITQIAAEAILVERYNENNMSFHHLEINALPFLDTSPILSQVYTFSEAAELWHIDPSTLRHRVSSEKLIEGVDFKKSGKMWLITKAAMEKLYGVL